MIARRTLVRLGFSQIICWAISFYRIGVFGAAAAVALAIAMSALIRAAALGPRALADRSDWH